jgi:hypothetical protein
MKIKPQRDMHQKDENDMKKMKKLIALIATLTLFASQVQAQEDLAPPAMDDSEAYYDSGRASYLSAALPIGALAVAAIIIATTDHHHHHSSSSSTTRTRTYSSSTTRPSCYSSSTFISHSHF